MAFITSPKDLKLPPKRIISLVPSQTELLYDLGLDAEVVGITKFCVHPESWFHKKTRVGGTKQLDLETIRALKPDLVIANKEENERVQVETIAKDFPVWVSDINDLKDAIEMINTVGDLTGKKTEAEKIAGQITRDFAKLATGKKRKIKVCYLIWRQPYMTVGGDTFISNMLAFAGFENYFSSLARYPEIKLGDLKNSGCEWILLSSEPYPFNEKHKEEIRLILPDMKIKFVDGEMFSWYGSRLLQFPAYIRENGDLTD
jgi:ABC-type Fe3+-hydroxamate transport system substrate-binding protein